MVVAALIISIAALLAAAMVALAMMELVADRQTGSQSTSEDTIEGFEVREEVAGTLASSHGLPPEIDGTQTHIALFLSPMCAMCSGIAESFDGEVPGGVTVVVTASSPARQRQWASTHRLSHQSVRFDDRMAIVESLGIASSPTAGRFWRWTGCLYGGDWGTPCVGQIAGEAH